MILEKSLNIFFFLIKNRFTLHYSNEKNINFICISDSNYSKILAYAFLEEISKEFFKKIKDPENLQKFPTELNSVFYDKFNDLIVIFFFKDDFY